MLFTNLRTYIILLFASAILLLAGCGSTPEIETAETNVEEMGVADGAAPPPQTSFELTGPEFNPYLAQEVSVPGAARALFTDAIRALQTEQWSRAETLLKQLNTDYPNLSGPYLNLGIVYRQLNQLELAEQAFTQAVSVNAMNLDALNQLALLKREQGDFAAAEQHYLAALKVWPRHDISHKNLGILYDLYMGQFAKALEHFELFQYLQDEPDRRVQGWIADLKRRVANLQAGAQQ